MFLGISEIINSLWENASLANSITIWQASMPIDFVVVGSWCVLFLFLTGISVWVLSDRRFSRLIEAISRNLLIVSSVIWICGVVLYLVGFYRPGLNWLSVVPRAIISSFKMFVVSNDLARVIKDLQEDVVYMSIFSLLHFAAAFITFLLIFKMVGYKIKSSLDIVIHKWFYAKGKNLHLFWGVNAASIILAEDIRRNYADDTIIFVDVDQESEDNAQRKTTINHIVNTITIKNSEIARLEAIGALVDHCYNGPGTLKGDKELDVFNLLHIRNIGEIVRKSNHSYFYFLSGEEPQNIAGALNLQHDITLREICSHNPIIYVHARRDATNEVLDHYSQYDGGLQRLEIKIVDSAYLAIATLKQNDAALPIHCIEVDKVSGCVDTQFTSLIVGFGDTGQEAFKFLYEYSAFVGSNHKKSPFKCYAIDERMNKIAGFIREKMPAISDDELVLIQSAVDSEAFWTQIKSIIGELNYVVIALNNDAMGLSLAVNIFKYALKSRLANNARLKILVRCYDNANEKRMSEVVNSLNNSIGDGTLEIQLFGMERELYCCNTILSDITLTEAKEFNRVYEGSTLTADEQWEKNFGEGRINHLMTNKGMLRYHAIYDINRCIAQNISNSLHIRTKMLLMGFDGEKSLERLANYEKYVKTRKSGSCAYDCEDENAKIVLLNAAMVEHERWVASHKLMGYTYAPETDCVRKHHKYLCDWDALDEEIQSYDCNVVDTTIKLEYAKKNKS